MTQDILTLNGTKHLWGDSAQTPDSVGQLTGLANGAGWVFTQWDRGPGASPEWYDFFASFQLQAAGTLNFPVEVWLAQSDGFCIQGEPGATSAALTSINQLLNMDLIVAVLNQAVAANTAYSNMGRVKLTARYITLVVWNRSGQSLRASTTLNFIRATPTYRQLQNAA